MYAELTVVHVLIPLCRCKKQVYNPKGQNEETRVSGAEQMSGLLLLSLIKVITPKLWCSELGLMNALGWRGFYFGEWKVSDLSSNEPCVNSPEAGACTEDPALIMLHPVGGFRPFLAR